MTTQYYSGPNYGGRFIAFVLALLLGAAAVVVLVRHAASGTLGRLATLITGRTTSFDTSVPAVVEKIQRLSRLETVVYSLDTVVEGDKTSAILPDALAGDRILLVVHGESIAGIDFSQLKPEDVRIDAGTPIAESLRDLFVRFAQFCAFRFELRVGLINLHQRFFQRLCLARIGQKGYASETQKKMGFVDADHDLAFWKF